METRRELSICDILPWFPSRRGHDDIISYVCPPSRPRGLTIRQDYMSACGTVIRRDAGFCSFRELSYSGGLEAFPRFHTS